MLRNSTTARSGPAKLLRAAGAARAPVQFRYGATPFVRRMGW